MADREYRRLTRTRNRSFFAVAFSTRSSLWLGNDHILQIDTSGYTESYKRFYFRDIQALALCTTRTWLYLAVLFASLAAVFGLIAFFGGPVAAWIFGIITAVFAICLLFDLLAGPTVKCHLRTAVQTEKLVSITRLRGARKVFGALRAFIANAQGAPKPASAAPATADAPMPPVISEVPPPSPAPSAASSSPPAADQT